MESAEAPPLLTGVDDVTVQVATWFDTFPWQPEALDAVRLSASDFLRALQDAGGTEGSPAGASRPR